LRSFRKGVTGQALQASSSHYRSSSSSRRPETDEDEDGVDVVGIDEHHHNHQRLMQHSPGQSNKQNHLLNPNTKENKKLQDP
jgi:hypothetical protein